MPVGPNDPASAYPPASSGVGTPCVFWGADTPDPDSTVSPMWAANDLVAAFTDAQVKPDDATGIQILTAGTYLITVEVAVQPDAEAEPADAAIHMSCNGGGFSVRDVARLADGNEVVLRLVYPTPLVVDDVVSFNVSASGAVDLTVTDQTLSLVRLG